VKNILLIFFQIERILKAKSNEPETEQSSEFWKNLNLDKLSLNTTERCFSDIRLVKGRDEVNYT